jgi:hypothetical protein
VLFHLASSLLLSLLFNCPRNPHSSTRERPSI